MKFATDTETQTHYAIKVFSREQMASRDLQTQIKKEIAIMKHVRHPNVVNLREVLASKTHVYIVLELVTGGELFDRIVTSGVRAPHRNCVSCAPSPRTGLAAHHACVCTQYSRVAQRSSRKHTLLALRRRQAG